MLVLLVEFMRCISGVYVAVPLVEFMWMHLWYLCGCTSGVFF